MLEYRVFFVLHVSFVSSAPRANVASSIVGIQTHIEGPPVGSNGTGEYDHYWSVCGLSSLETIPGLNGRVTNLSSKGSKFILFLSYAATCVEADVLPNSRGRVRHASVAR